MQEITGIIKIISEMKSELSDDLCLFEGDDYTMLTNYGTAVRCGDIGDCLPNHSF